MAAERHRELGCKFFEAQDRLRGGPDPDLCASNYLARIGGNPPMTLPDHQAFANAFYAGFPNLRHTVEETIADDAKVVVRFTLRGTHQGEFMGIQPSQKDIEVGAIAILSIANGKVTEVRGQFDQLGMMRQLGVIQ
ncbi:ester cyclase [Fontimonas sp. SYSU GA230001]|uniref:ester cyclase n=1 Tax=Fontimonas sp. SYSU GA230001 TaxID=3142450 RepID=UPI0032B3308F